MVQMLFFTLILFSVAKANLIGKNQGLDAIYGHDERSLVNKRSQLKIKELSKSIALIISKDVVRKKFTYSLIDTKPLSDPEGMNICPEEKFADRYTFRSSCTGFLIGEDLVASAGHCFTSARDCDGKLVIFNVQTKKEAKAQHVVSNQNIYECSEILSSFSSDIEGRDFSVIRLKKKVMGSISLKMRNSGAITTDDQVFMIGHSMGLPLVATANAQVSDIHDPHIFKAPLDSFEGSSGSPVFNSKTFEVEGILVRGEEDFFKDESRQCYRYEVYDEGTKELPTIRGEAVTRIGDLSEVFNFLLKKNR